LRGEVEEKRRVKNKRRARKEMTLRDGRRENVV